MKHLRRFQISLFLCLLVLIAMLPLSVLAEDVELLSEAAELTVPEEDVLLGGAEAEEPGYAEFVGEVAVSAAGDVAIDETNFPDENFRDYVSEEFDTDGSGVLSENERASVMEIYVEYIGIASLKGIEWFTELEYLYCSGNGLTNLDVSKNTKLVWLDCDGNQLTSLDVSKNTALEALNCMANQLTNLDVSKNTTLTDLECEDNQLTSLNVGKNAVLSFLGCGMNQLTNLDVSKNTALTELRCFGNQLTSLDISKNVALLYLYCDENNLRSLDVSRNTKLIEFSCQDNQLTGLDVSKNTELHSLTCNDNEISYIDISNCPILCDLAKTSPNIAAGYAFFEVFTDDEYNCIGIDLNTALIANGKAVYGTLPTPALIDLSGAKLTVKAQTYTSRALKPVVTVKLDGKKLKKGTDYTVKYKNNTKIGTATVTVTGKGSYTGSVKKTFKINPKKVSGLSLKAGKKQIKVTWKKRSGVTAYQVQYATKKDFSNAKKVTVTKAATIKTTIKKLKAKKTYYVRIRTYKKVSGKKYYSKWSSAKKIKTK